METMSTPRNDNSRFPFTSTQWQELEHQALVYKYMISGMPIPPDLLFSIKRSLDPSTKLILHHHSPHQSMGWNCFQMGFGRKIDPEPGRCRRTDGKKWRCSKEAYPDSKYCERHMHRGRNRSRKPVEVNSAAPALSICTKSQNCPSPGSFMYPQLSRPGNVLSSQDRFLLESSCPYSHSEKDHSHRYGMKEEIDGHPLMLSESHGIMSAASMGDDSWHLEPLSMNKSSSSSSQSKQRDYEMNGYSYQRQADQKQEEDEGISWYDELGLKNDDDRRRNKDEPQKVMHHFFDESPHILDDNQDSSSTQLSISIPIPIPRPTSCAHDFFLTHNEK